MKVKKYSIIFGLFVVFLAFIILVSASFEIGDQNYSIQNNYLEDSYLSGWINISFDQMSADSLFTDSLDNNATLIEALNQNTNYNYSCDTLNCESTYTASGKSSTKTFQLHEGEEKLIGFKIKDTIESIDSLTMTLQSNAQSSCYSQVKLDFGNDETIEANNNKSSTTYCPLIYGGCFEENGTGWDPGSGEGGSKITGKAILGDPQDILLTDNPLCQKIQLPEAPKIGIGAWIKESTPGNRQVRMELMDSQGNLLDNCTLSKATMTTAGKRIVCSTNFKVLEPQEKYVCIHVEGTSGEYKTRGFIPENESCGFIGYPPATATSAYDLFAKSLNFAPVGTLTIGNELQGNQTVAEIIEQYILEKYESLDCSDECLVPLNIISNKEQTITLNNLKLKYNKVGLGLVEGNYFYDFVETPSKINASFQKLFLDNLFLISNQTGEINYQLFLENTEIINEGLTVEALNMSINPLITAAEVPTDFKVNIVPSKNIKKYEWTFGDGTTKTTTASSVEHTYPDIQNYTLTVTATKNDTEDTLFKSFTIEVKSPETVILEKIEEIEANIESLRTELNNFDVYTRQRVEEFLNLDEKEIQLDELKSRFEVAEDEQEFISIAKALFALEIPDSMIISGLGEVVINIKPENIDVDLLSQITGENYDVSNRENYVNSILMWSEDNFKIRGSTKKVYLKYGDVTELGLTIFSLRFEKGSLEPYFILEYSGNLNMDVNYSEMQGNKYLQITPSMNSLKIDTTEEIEITDLAIFVSPSISELSLINIEDDGSTINKKWFVWVILAVVVIALIFAYFGMKNSRKNKVESQLFKGKQNLHQITKYIDDEKNKGISNEFIVNNLKKAGWTIGQIKYAMKANSKIGKISFSLFSFITNKHKKINKDRKTK